MGTNYFGYRRISDAHKEIIRESLNDTKSVHEIMSEYFPIHLCKTSSGWKILWNFNDGKYFEPNKKSLFEFLKTVDIYDEYDRFIPYDEFINKVVEWDKSNKLTITNNVYDTIYNIDGGDDIKERFGVTVFNGEFTSDDLRFAIFDFS